MRPTARFSLVHCASLTLVAALAFGVACAVDKPQSPDHTNQSQSIEKHASRTWAQSIDPANTAFFEFQVDAPVTPREPLQLHYPASLKGSGIGGEVWTQFVVDQTGHVDMSSFKVLKSPDPRLTAAIKAALPRWQFDPAHVHGTNVKQLVEQAFVFRPPPDA